MDLEFQVKRSLPPLVEGKIHGYLSISVDEIIWNRRSPGSVSVLVCWWGELDNAQLTPGDVKPDTEYHRDCMEVYAIRTNLDLFKQYLKNSESVELLFISEKTQKIIGSAKITDLLDILVGKPCIRYYRISSDDDTRIGEIHVTVQLTVIQKSFESPLKSEESKKKKLTARKHLNERSTAVDANIYNKTKFNLKEPIVHDSMPKNTFNEHNNDNTYRSILRDKRSDLNHLSSRSNFGITDKLVAQVVARAQRLRGAMFNDTNDDDPLILSEGSTLDSFRSEKSAENEAALYEYFMGKQMSRRSEKKALETLRSQSPTASLIDFAAETIRSCNGNKSSPNSGVSMKKIQTEVAEEPVPNVQLNIQQVEACPIDYVDSLRIIVESLTLNDAGYRRVKSSCLLRGDGVPISVTYFVQYDAIFAKPSKKLNGNKPVKMCSKGQNGQVINFNHAGVYDLSKSHLHMDMPLKFRIFHRHLNQRTPTELGVGSMYIGDAARSPALSAAQRLAIVKKGIKIGELKVTVELGCDKIHFGKQFVEAVTSAKENIPVLELSTNSNMSSHRHKTTTGTGSESKSNSRITSGPGRQENWTTSTIPSRLNKKDSLNDCPSDERVVYAEVPRMNQEKILLHGLIYIGEGKNLEHTSTYLICRAFWREDRALSRVCEDTTNPFYNFHQIVPLIHGAELLERTKDNCIITEVYSKDSARADSLLGIAKLPVHQLYIAYRDPLVLPHLLKSKYPVISVDGWVPITDPVSGRLCGELLALVALGTADQIALLEMTRGLRNSAVTRGVPAANEAAVSSRNCLDDLYEGTGRIYERDVPRRDEKHEGPSIRTQECQTELSTVSELKSQRLDDLQCNHDDTNRLTSIVDRLAQALSVPRTISEHDTHLETELPTREPPEKISKARNIEPLCLDALNSNSFSGDSSDNSPRDNFNMPREIFRSVGVGAEFEEPTPSQNYGANTDVGTSFEALSESPTKNNKDTRHDPTCDVEFQAEEIDFHSYDGSSFRAIIEIECALHLPRMESDESVEPCTYVTFQKVRNSSTDRLAAYMMTNVCPYNCNPKYEWRCDTRLSTDLLVNEEKRLIMKVWRLIEPEQSMIANLEKDVVLGFSAIDLSVLIAGFPTVSGWFHIMDFAGKCNGQLKVSVTPLDNITTLGKYTGITRSALPSSNHSNLSSPYPQDLARVEELNTSLSCNQRPNENPPIVDPAAPEPPIDVGFGLSEPSMSLLSLSLKQKFTELDEIQKRLESRLQDVTSTAFDDDFDDFDLPEHDTEIDNDKNGNTANIAAQELTFWGSQPIDNIPSDRNTNTDRTTNGNHCMTSVSEPNYPPRMVSDNHTSSGYSSSSNFRPGPVLTNGSGHYSTREHKPRPADEDTRFFKAHNGHSRTNILDYQVNDARNCRNEANSGSGANAGHSTIDNHYFETNHPTRGTRVHINHLLDQLSTQLTAAPPPITSLPMKRNIMDLISTLRRNNNNFSSDVKCNREAHVRTVPTQTESNYTSSTGAFNHPGEALNNPLPHDPVGGRDEEVPAKRREKISAVIREELITDDNDSPDFDLLSTHLMTSNVRHLGVSNTLNPLLYPHVLPEIAASDTETAHEVQHVSTSTTPEGEAIESLDSRYTAAFSAKINRGLGGLTSLTDFPSRISRGLSALENSEAFRVTPSGISENVDGNIDVTVVHKPCNDDLMASNSVETTTTVSLDNGMQTATEIDDNSSLNSFETSVSAASRQAPDGGNPAEDPNKIFIAKPNDYTTDSSSSSS